MVSDTYTGPHAIALDSWITTAPFEDLLGMKIVSASQGRAVLTMPFLRSHAQGLGFMHGGALISLADTAMAMAVKSLFPEAKLAIGPAIENGFYYDFDVTPAFSPDDLPKLEKEGGGDHE